MAPSQRQILGGRGGRAAEGGCCGGRAYAGSAGGLLCRSLPCSMIAPVAAVRMHVPPVLDVSYEFGRAPPLATHFLVMPRAGRPLKAECMGLQVLQRWVGMHAWALHTMECIKHTRPVLCVVVFLWSGVCCVLPNTSLTLSALLCDACRRAPE